MTQRNSSQLQKFKTVKSFQRNENKKKKRKRRIKDRKNAIKRSIG